MLLNSVIYILYFLDLSMGIGQYIYYSKWPWPVTNGIESLMIQSESHQGFFQDSLNTCTTGCDIYTLLL